MKGSVIPGRTDVILSVATLALAIVAAGVIAATSSTGEFVAWAWARHHNILSWYVRPLFILPFCFFAYRRSLFGIVLTILALATSMFWFPVPEHSEPGRERDAEGRKRRTSPPTGRSGRSLSPCWYRSPSRRWGWPSGDDRWCGDWRWSTRRSSSRSRGRFSSAPRRAPCPTCRPPCWASWSATP